MKLYAKILPMEIHHDSFLVLTSIAFLAIFFSGKMFTLAGDDLSVTFTRNSFPDDFVFGTSSASYQYEGAAKEGGKGPSIWDTFTHEHPEKITGQANGDVALNFYHLYKEDISKVKYIGMDAFRISISWPRILPKGKLSGGVNHEGIKFYNNLIDELISNGIKPFVTLFHWDLPQALETEYEGFLRDDIVNDYLDYVDICFKEFGDRVKHWMTFNEPLVFIQFGYEQGIHAPGRCSNYLGKCDKGNSGKEPYIVVHNQLLCHAAAAKLYRENYKETQRGEIGMAHATNWFEPRTSSHADVEAKYRLLDFQLGWLMHPVTYGDYPPVMRSYVGNRLPRFTKEQSELLKGSMDFVGLNYYTTNYASNNPYGNTIYNRSYTSDARADFSTHDENGNPICEPTPLFWLFICPTGIRDLMHYIKNKYKDPVMYITENGMADMAVDIDKLPLEKALMDHQRVRYFKSHLWNIREAIKDGIKVKGHFAWSFLDNFEWSSGYTVRFGLNYVDYKADLRRYPKLSAAWYMKFLHGGRGNISMKRKSENHPFSM